MGWFFFFVRQLNASVVQTMLTGLSVQFLLYYSDVNVVLFHQFKEQLLSMNAIREKTNFTFHATLFFVMLLDLVSYCIKQD